MLQTIQIGANTADMPGTLRLYAEAFGFRNAGSQGFWGPILQVQGHDPDVRARALMWWMVGRQRFFQLEFFHHTQPKQRPLRSDWRPNDLGWVRFGIAVKDLEACLTALRENGVEPLTDPMTIDGVRSFAFRDPFIGCMVEAIEDAPGITERFGLTSGDGPAVVYATSSVSDIGSARSHYRDTLGCEIGPIERLHRPEHEALWGLEGAQRTGFLAQRGEVFLEIVQYTNPMGRRRPADYRASDQGIVNIALGSRSAGDVREALDRLSARGLVPPYLVEGDTVLAGYIIDPERELEVVSLPEEMDAYLGFTATVPFLSSDP